MKVGIVTFYNAINYGAVLQAWALRRCLTQFGHDVVIADVFPKPFLRTVIGAFVRGEWRQLLLLCKFHRFVFCRLAPSKDISSADCFVAGSDQVWNVNYYSDKQGLFNSHLFLSADCVGQKRRISYAASIGDADLGHYKYLEELKRALGKFDRISVREDDARQKLKAIGIDSIVVPDPSLLLPREEYMELCGKSSAGRKYVFGYFLSGREEGPKVLSALVKNNSCRVVCVTLGGGTLRMTKNFSTSDWTFPICSPEEWIGHIKSASLVVTDSFHGVMFSIKFHREFIFVPMKGRDGMNCRVCEVLDRCGLSSRSVSGVEMLKDDFKVESIDWHAVDSRIDAFIATGKEFLRESL